MVETVVVSSHAKVQKLDVLVGGHKMVQQLVVV
jgi:hypothetical protein